MPELSGQTLIVKQLADCQRKLGIIPGAFIPVGGNTNQVLGKLSPADYDTGWMDILGGIVLAGRGIVFSGGNTVNFAQAAAYTAGRTPYCATGATIGFDARYWFWDAANGYLGYGTEVPANPLDVVRVSAEAGARLYYNFILELTANATPLVSRRCLHALAFTSGATNFTEGLCTALATSSVAQGSGDSPGVGRKYIAHECYHGKGLSGTGDVGVTGGVYIRSTNENVTGVIDECTDLWIDTPLTTGVITTNYAVKQESTTALMQWFGKSGLGIAPSATSWATLGASTASISSLRVTAGTAAYTGTVEGDFWNDYTQKCLIGYIDGLKQFDSRVSFVMTDSKTVTNTNAETTCFGTGIGTLTFPANFFVVGKTLRITLRGHHTMDATPPDLNFRVKLGGVTFATKTYSDLNDTNRFLEISFILTCRTTGAGGTGIGQGFVGMAEGADSYDFDELVMTATAAINTTGTLALDVTVQPSAADAGSTLTITNGIVEVIA